MPAGRAWTADDDAQLMAALERGEGTLTWSAIAREAFPDGKFGKQDCQDVRRAFPIASEIRNASRLLRPSRPDGG